MYIPRKCGGLVREAAQLADYLRPGAEFRVSGSRNMRKLTQCKSVRFGAKMCIPRGSAGSGLRGDTLSTTCASVSGFGFRRSSFGFRISGFDFRVSGVGFGRALGFTDCAQVDTLDLQYKSEHL